MSSQYFPPYVVSKNNNIKVILDLSGDARENDLRYFRGKDYAEQSYLFFEPKYKSFETSVVSIGTNVLSWESKGISNEEVVPIVESTYDTYPFLDHIGEKLSLDFSFVLLRQNEVTYNHGTIVNIYIV